MAFLFYIFIALIIINLLIITSKIEIGIDNFKYLRKNKKDFFSNKINIQRKKIILVNIKLYLLGKIPVLSIKVDEDKLKRLEKMKVVKSFEKRIKKRMNKLETEFFKNFNKNINSRIVEDVIEFTNKLKCKLKNIQLKVNLGFENVILTSISIPIVTTIISLLLRNIEFNVNNNHYEVCPIYNLEDSRSEINICLKCIIELKMIHIISIMYIIKKQRRVKENGRTSNRRSYDYSYE